MTIISDKLYSVLNLPVPANGQKLSSGYNDFTSRIDGNTDSSGNDRIDPKDKNGLVDEWELWQEILCNRARYEVELRQLRTAGFEDIYEETPEMTAHVEALLARYNPQTNLEKAVLLMRSLLPPDYSFEFNEVKYSGLALAEGGLAIPYNNNHTSPLRVGRGNLLPKEVLSAKVGERHALCSEYSALLAVFLRIAGIEAKVKTFPAHALVVTLIDGMSYNLDPAKLTFTQWDYYRPLPSDREASFFHHLDDARKRWLLHNYNNDGSSIEVAASLGTPAEVAAEERSGAGFVPGSVKIQ